MDLKSIFSQLIPLIAGIFGSDDSSRQVLSTTTTTTTTSTTTPPPPPLPLQCGKSIDSTLTPLVARIVGGHLAAKGQISWQISLQKYHTGIAAWYHACGGSIISDRWILTAAHCVYGAETSRLRIEAGTLNLQGPLLSTSQVLSVTKIIAHSDYEDDLLNFDIAVLKLEKSLKFSDTVHSVCLPRQDETFSVGSPATVSGWGSISESGPPSPRLMATTVHIVSESDCLKNNYDANLKVSFCAGEMDTGGKDACQGDSGGPLTIRQGDRSFQIGIVSWGYGCGLPDYPGVYTRVSHFVDWITAAIEENGGTSP